MAIEKPKHHIFVCSSARLTGENKGFCLQQNSKEIIAALVEEIQDRDLESDVMVTNTGCVGLCTKGPVVMIYPEQIWYGNVSVDDVEEIMECLEEGEVLSRLAI